MASKSKEKPVEEEQRLERRYRNKNAIIRRQMCKLGTAGERVLCSNWLQFFSCCPKTDHRARDYLLDQMMRQLRQQGKLSQPFTTHVRRRCDLNQLLDEEGRRRLRLSSVPRVVLSSVSSKDSRAKQLSPFIWLERVKHLSALEEQYRREERKRWLHECTAIQDIGVQVELPVPVPRPEDDNVCDRARKVKERRDQERQRDRSLGLQNVAEWRQLERQQVAEARRLQQRRLLEQQAKVKERRDHERRLVNKRREAQSPHPHPSRGNRGPKTLSQRQKQGKPVRAGKKSGTGQEARKPVMGHPVAEDLEAENIKKKLMAYEELKQYQSKKALEERERLKREKAAVQEAKQSRTVGGVVGKGKGSENIDQIGKQEQLKKKEKAPEKTEQRPKEDIQRNTQRQCEGERAQNRKEERKELNERKEEVKENEKDEDSDGKVEEDFLRKFQKYRKKKRKQMELKEKEKPRKDLEQTQKNGMQRKSERQLEIERKLKDLAQREEEEDREERRLEDLQRKSQKKLEEKRKEEQKEKPREFEEKQKARKESEQKRDQQRECQGQLQNEREMAEQIIDDSQMEYLNRREKELLQKWVDLQKKYDEVPAGQLSPASENKFRKKELKAKKKFLQEATEHRKRLSKEIAKMTKNEHNFSPEKFKVQRLPKMKEERQTKGRVLLAGDRNLGQSKNSMALRQGHDKFVKMPQPDAYEEVQSRLQLHYRCQEIEMQKHLDRQRKLFAQNEELFTQCWQKTQANWLRADVIRGKCMKELQDIQATRQMISAEQEKLATASLEHAKRFGNLNPAGDLRLQAGSNFYNFPALSDARSNGGEVNDLAAQRTLKVIYQREPQRCPRGHVLFCTQTGRKRYPSVCTTRGASRRPLHCRSFTQILGGKEQTEYSPRILTANNRILERKLFVAKASALNKHFRKSLLQEASQLIDGLLHESKAKTQSSTKPPSYIFQTLIDPLLQAVEEFSPNVVEDINQADNQLETHLGSLLDPQGAQPLDEELSQEQPLVSEVLHDFYDLEPQLNEILQRIDQKYRQWRDEQPDLL